MFDTLGFELLLLMVVAMGVEVCHGEFAAFDSVRTLV